MMNYFLYCNTIPIDETSQSYCYYIAISMVNLSKVLHSLNQAIQTFSATVCHVSSMEFNENSFFCIPFARRKVRSDFSWRFSLRKTNYRVDASLNATMLISSNQESTVVYRPYPHNLLLLQLPLKLVSHISFMITILNITLYLEWHSILVLRDISYK